MRTKFQSLGENRALMTVDNLEDYDGSRPRIEIEYWAPSSGGYVHEVSDSRPGTSGPQVCDGLARHGNTLRWMPAYGSLVDMIRREYRRSIYREYARGV